MRRTNWCGCWSTWRPAPESAVLSLEKKQKKNMDWRWRHILPTRGRSGYASNKVPNTNHRLALPVQIRASHSPGSTHHNLVIALRAFTAVVPRCEKVEVVAL